MWKINRLKRKELLKTARAPQTTVRALVFSARFATVKGGCNSFTHNAKGTMSMAQYVKFDELKARVSIRKVPTHYGLMQAAQEKSSKRGVELRLHCPFHDDTTPSLSIQAESGKFHCFGCNTKGGDIFDFVVAKEGIQVGDRTQNRRRAALLIQDWMGVSSDAAAAHLSAAALVAAPAADPTPAEAAPDEGTNPPLKFTFKYLDTRHPYLTQVRGLKEATIDAFGLGHHSGRGIMQNRVVIPIHNELGELIAYAGRWPADTGWPNRSEKYQLPPGFKKNNVLFNLQLVASFRHHRTPAD
jgi:hypothetical protein